MVLSPRKDRPASPINMVRSFLAKRAESVKERRTSFASSARASASSARASIRMSTSKAATTLQASWRGQLSRRSTKNALVERSRLPFPKRKPTLRPEESHQAKMAAFFWELASPQEQLRQLNRLQEELAKTACKPAVAAAAVQSAKAPAARSSAHDPLGQSAPTTTPSAAEISSAVKLQARIRGKQARSHSMKKVPVKSPPQTSGISLTLTLTLTRTRTLTPNLTLTPTLTLGTSSSSASGMAQCPTSS